VKVATSSWEALRTLGEILGFRYSNEIGVENEHFSFATLNDK